MSERSGIGSGDLAVLEAIDKCGDDFYVPCSRVVAAIHELLGLGLKSAYDTLLALATDWEIAVPLVDTLGNIGDRLYGPGDGPQHTECRISGAGRAVLNSERSRTGPVPAGLINGNMYNGGTQPPLPPERVIAALRYLLRTPNVSDGDVLAMVGPPLSITGCTITGDLDALNSGRRIMLRQTGHIRLNGDPAVGAASGVAAPNAHTGISGSTDRWLDGAQLVIESLPPGAYPDKVSAELARHRGLQAGSDEFRSGPALPIVNVANAGTSEMPIRIAITIAPGADILAARDQIAAFDGVTTQTVAAYPEPLASLLRRWTDQFRNEDLTASLAAYEAAIETR